MSVTVSVIVPVYNVERYVAQCLDSLAAQTLPGIEVIVVDDGSTDGSSRIVEEFAQAHPGTFRVVRQPNAGVSTARNTGLDLACGEYVAFVDSDDYVVPEMLELLYTKARAASAEIAVCGYWALDSRTGEMTYVRRGWPKEYGTFAAENPALLLAPGPHLWNKIFSRDLLEASGLRFPDGKLFEDTPVVYPLLALANRIVKVQHGLYYYRRFREGAITHSYSPRNIEMLEMLDLMNERFREHGLFERYEEQILLINCRHVLRRLEELPGYDGFGVKRRFAKACFSHMDQEFPQWRENRRVQEKYGGTWRFRALSHRLTRGLYTLSPRALHDLADAVSTAWGSVLDSVRTTVNRFGVERRLRLAYTRDVRRLPVDGAVALFESNHGADISDAPLYLMRDLASRNTHRVHVAVRDTKRAAEFLRDRGIDATPVAVGSRRYVRLLATAGYLVNDLTFPPYLIKREEQRDLNTGRGTPLKTYGKSVPHAMRDLSAAQADFLKADYLLFSNEYARAHIMRDHMVEGVARAAPLVMGSPRNEVLFDADEVAQARERLGLGNKRVILYLPSWRGVNPRQLSRGFVNQIDDNVASMDEALGEDDVLIVKDHYLVESNWAQGEYKTVLPAPADLDCHELLALADVLVTDYSSVVFDFASTRREIVLFTYDAPDYRAGRGLYLDLDELPFPHFDTVEGLAEHLAARRPFRADEAYEAFAARFTSLDGPNASAAVNDRVIGEEAVRVPEPAQPTAGANPVELIFVPYLHKSGQAVFEELLESEAGRSDVVFVIPTRQYASVTNRYLIKLYTKRGIHINYVLTTDRMLVSVGESLALWVHRTFGVRLPAVDRVWELERRRLFGTMVIAHARDISGYWKFRTFAEALNRMADSQ